MHHAIIRKLFKQLQFDGIVNTQAEFGQKLGYSESFTSLLLNGKEPAPKDLQKKIEEAFAMKWEAIDMMAIGENRTLLVEAKSTKNTTDPANSVKEPDDNYRVYRDQRPTREHVNVPFYDVDFEAGTGIEFYDDIRTNEPSYIMDVPAFAGCTAFRTYGQSMEPLINGGAILFGTMDEEWKDYLEYGQIYGIVCNNGRRFLKKVRKSKQDNTHLLLVSENIEYDEFDLPRDLVKSMWLIHGWLNKRT